MSEKEPKMESPFSDAELQEIFEKQKSKIPFELRKNIVVDKNNGVIRISGKSLNESYYDIWHDDYILHFDTEFKTSGSGFGHNRFSTFDEFKSFVFKTFNLTEQAQISLF